MARGVIITPAGADRIDAAVRSVLGGGQQHPFRRATPSPIAGLAFLNLSGHEIPPYGIVKITGATTADGAPVFKAVRPDAGCGLHVVNDGGRVGLGETGLAQVGPLVRVALDDPTATFTFGDLLGQYADSFDAKQFMPGLVYLSRWHEDDPSTALAYLPSELVFLAKATADIGAGATGDVTMLQADGSTKTSPALTVEAVNPSGVAVTQDSLLNVRAWPEREEYRINEAFLCTEA